MRDAILLLGFVTLQRLFELLLSRRNEARLKLRGAVEAGANHYPVMVALHVLWLAVLWLLAWNVEPNMLLVAAFLALQPLRYWVIATLGDRWTTRVFVIPGASLIRTGPYRFFSHPNYLIVVLEIALLPLAFGLIWAAVVFSALNAALLAWRIRIEQRALTEAAAAPASALANTGQGG
jgi:methyltransferase